MSGFNPWVRGSLFDPANAAITGGTIKGTNVPYIVGQSFVAVSAGVDTTKDTLATITIPANALGANGCIDITFNVTVNNSAGTKLYLVEFSGLGGTQYFSVTHTTQTTGNYRVRIGNVNATNSQQGGGWGAVGTAISVTTPSTTSAVDTTAQTTVVISGTKNTSGDTLTLRDYTALVCFAA